MNAALLPPFAEEYIVPDDFSEVRQRERNFLEKRIAEGKHTVVVSDPGMGRSVIVSQAADSVLDDRHLLFTLLADRAFSAYDFLEQYLENALTALCPEEDDFRHTVQKYLANVSAAVISEDDEHRRIIIGDTEFACTHMARLLALPKQIADDRGLTLIGIIDHFEEVADYSGGMSLTAAMAECRRDKTLPSLMLACTESRRYHLLFEANSAPLKRFAKKVEMHPISADEWTPYLQVEFAHRGKHLRIVDAHALYEKVQGASAYILREAWHLWTQTEERTSEETVEKAFELLLNAVSPGFIVLTRVFNADQTALIKALIAGTDLSDKAARKAAGFETIDQLEKTLKDLRKLGIVRVLGKKKPTITDPVLASWLAKRWKPKTFAA